MIDVLLQLLMFTVKAIVVVALILFLMGGLVSIFSRAKEKLKCRITIKNINHVHKEHNDELMHEILPRKQFKKFIKKEKKDEKLKKDLDPDKIKNVYVLNFNGDIKASALTHFREEVTAVLGIAQPKDEIVVCLESGGGMVHAYGLAAAQLLRIREQKIPLTIIVDKIAASGGYMMACIADKLLAAPFSIIGSIGVIFQLPNFHRYLKDKNIDFEQVTAGNYKRTLTVFGQNTEEGRLKLRQEIDDIHHLFKNLIKEYRKDLDIERVSTGEHWLGKQALELKLVDGLTTSDDYIVQQSKNAHVYEINYVIRKSLSEKMHAGASMIAGLFKRSIIGI